MGVHWGRKDAMQRINENEMHARMKDRVMCMREELYARDEIKREIEI